MFRVIKRSLPSHIFYLIRPASPPRGFVVHSCLPGPHPYVHHSSAARLTCTDVTLVITLSYAANKSYLNDIMIPHPPVGFLSKEKQTRMIRHFHFHGWPEIGIPAEGKGMIDIIAAVQKQQQQSGNHPIVVHCRYNT